MSNIDPAMLGYFKSNYVPRLQLFVAVFKERFLNSFGTLEDEAQAVSDGFWAQWCESAFDENDAPDTMADAALQAGVDFYISLMSARQAYINLAAVGLYHAWEQQVFEFYRGCVIGESYADPVTHITLAKFQITMKGAGICTESFSSFDIIETLQLCANAVKHGDGKSASELRERRPDLFVRPGIHEQELRDLMTSRKLYTPLSGEDLYVTESDLDAFLDGTVQFWTDMTKALQTNFKGSWFSTSR